MQVLVDVHVKAVTMKVALLTLLRQPAKLVMQGQQALGAVGVMMFALPLVVQLILMVLACAKAVTMKIVLLVLLRP